VLAVSYRQVKRLYRRFRTEGARGLTHRSAGRRSNAAREDGEHTRILALVREKYSGTVDERFGPTLAAEHLASEDGIHVHHDTLRRWMLAAGLWSRRRKRSVHRRRRERKPHFGELVQLDGSSKGRIERHHGTHQDRLVKKLRRQAIVDVATANAFLDAEYWREHNHHPRPLSRQHPHKQQRRHRDSRADTGSPRIIRGGRRSASMRSIGKWHGIAGHGSARSRDEESMEAAGAVDAEERAHRSLENPRTVFHKLPQTSRSSLVVEGTFLLR
jgi:transposase